MIYFRKNYRKKWYFYNKNLKNATESTKGRCRFERFEAYFVSKVLIDYKTPYLTIAKSKFKSFRKKQHTTSNINANWMAQGYNQMDHSRFTADEVSIVIQELYNWKLVWPVSIVLQELYNWKLALPDGIHNFWLKILWRTHE